MKTKMRIPDYLLEILASIVVIALYFFNLIGWTYAIVGLIIALSLTWPFRLKRKSPSAKPQL